MAMLLLTLRSQPKEITIAFCRVHSEHNHEMIHLTHDDRAQLRRTEVCYLLRRTAFSHPATPEKWPLNMSQ
jgi:hypothetical protein